MGWIYQIVASQTFGRGCPHSRNILIFYATCYRCWNCSINIPALQYFRNLIPWDKMEPTFWVTPRALTLSWQVLLFLSSAFFLLWCFWKVPACLLLHPLLQSHSLSQTRSSSLPLAPKRRGGCSWKREAPGATRLSSSGWKTTLRRRCRQLSCAMKWTGSSITSGTFTIGTQSLKSDCNGSTLTGWHRRTRGVGSSRCWAFWTLGEIRLRRRLSRC